MKIRFGKIFVLFFELALLGALPSFSFAATVHGPFSIKGKPTYVPGEVLVTLKAGAPADARLHALSMMGSAKSLTRVNLYKITIAGAQSVEQAIDQLRSDPAVAAVQPNYRYYATGCSAPPTDPYYTGAVSIGQSGPYWPFQRIDAPASVFSAYFSSCSLPSGAPVTVAVMDSGIDTSHSDLPAGITVTGENTLNVSPDVLDDFGHGTLVTSLIAAQWDGNGMAGLAGIPGLVKIMPMKVLDNTGSGSTESIVDGLDFAFVNGAQIFNMSLGGPSDPIEQEEINKLLSHNCVVVAAAGNDSQLPEFPAGLEYPAAYPGVIAVGATDENDQVAFYSNVGPGLDLVAPGGFGVSFIDEVYDPNSDIFGLLAPAGTSLFVSDPNYTYAELPYCTGAGSSFSTPLVTATAAMLLALNPGMTNLEVTNRIINSAKSLNGNRGWDRDTGYGLLDVARALQSNGAQVTPFMTTFNSPNPFSLQGDLTPISRWPLINPNRWNSPFKTPRATRFFTKASRLRI
jgi:subtilisin family serine protease